MNLTREDFCLDLIRDMSGALEDAVGLDEAEGYMAIVGRMMGDRLHAAYGYAAGDPVPREKLAALLVDLKARLGASFAVEEATAQRLTLVNGHCPFGSRVEGRRSLCMMTSNVFGSIAAESTGYAKVELQKTIAAGDGHCRVLVHFQKTPVPGREYYKLDD